MEKIPYANKDAKMTDKTTKLSSHTRKEEERKYSSKSKVPYYRDEFREEERLKRLYGKEACKMYSKHNYRNTKYKGTSGAHKNNCKCKKSSENPNSLNIRTNVTFLPRIIYIPVPLLLPNPYMRFINNPMSTPLMMTPVHRQQMQKYSYMCGYGPIHTNNYVLKNRY
ncbi:uncharacterized protein ACRADG_002257 [Cochliomyia hominivorax]